MPCSFALQRYRIFPVPAGAGSLAECRAYPGGKFREVVGLLQAVVCLPPSSPWYTRSFHSGTRLCSGQPEVMPHDLHARLAERHAAVHAARALHLLPLLRQRNVELIKVFDPLLRRNRRGSSSLSYSINPVGFPIFYPSRISFTPCSLIAICIKCFNLCLLTAQTFLLHLNNRHHAYGYSHAA